MSDSRVLYVGNSNVIEVADLHNEVTGDVVNNATVTMRLLDSDGDPVAGETWPLTLAYVTDSDGLYRATLIDTLPLTDNGRYVAEVTAIVSGSLKAFWRLDCLAKTRR
jgi:hypothetical protein